MGKPILVSFEYDGHIQNFKILESESVIKGELVKFICYLEDFSMFNYFSQLIKNSSFNFNESFFIKNLQNNSIVEELEKNKKIDAKSFSCHFIIDLDCEMLCRVGYSHIGLLMYKAYPFEGLCEFPYQN